MTRTVDSIEKTVHILALNSLGFNLPDVIFDNAKPVFKEGLKDIHEFETRDYPDDV